jgi:gliding motility-associated-like protein
MNTSGKLTGLKQIGGAGADIITSAKSSPEGDIYLTGIFEQTVNFGACFSDITRTSAGRRDAFIMKMSDRFASVSLQSSAIEICVGSPITFTAIPIDAGITPDFQWQVNGINTGPHAPVFTTAGLSDGDYVRVIVIPSCQGFIPDTSIGLQVRVKPFITPQISIAPFPSRICDDGNPVTFTAAVNNPGTSQIFQWRVNGTTTGNNSRVLTIIDPHEGDAVDCILTSTGDCVMGTVSSNSIIIKFDAGCPKGFYMPTGFTPDHNGTNDFCKPLIFGHVISYHFSIYNRWGEKIFDTKDKQKGWDGTIKGAQQNSGIFIWTCTYQFSGQSPETKKGTVALIR